MDKEKKLKYIEGTKDMLNKASINLALFKRLHKALEIGKEAVERIPEYKPLGEWK